MEKKNVLKRADARRVEDWLLANRIEIERDLTLGECTTRCAVQLGLTGSLTESNVRGALKTVGVTVSRRRAFHGRRPLSRPKATDKAVLRALCRFCVKLAEALDTPIEEIIKAVAEGKAGARTNVLYELQKQVAQNETR